MHQEAFLHNKLRKIGRQTRREPLGTDIILHPSDYSLVVTTISLYSNLIVDTTRWKCVHSLNSRPCFLNKTQADSNACQAIHYGICIPVESPFVFAFGKEDKSKPVDAFIGEEYSTYHLKTATKSGKKATTNNSRTAKASSPTLSDCAAIQLLAEDVEGKLETLLKTFVSEEKIRQEARLNLLNKSSSLSSLNSDFSSLSSSPSSSPNSPELFKDAGPKGNRNNSSSASSTDYGSLSRQISSSPSSAKQSLTLSGYSSSKQWDPSGKSGSSGVNSLNASSRVTANSDVGKVSPLTTEKEKNVQQSQQAKMEGNKSSQVNHKQSGTLSPERRDASPSRMVFGLHEKTPKSKYVQLISERQGFSSHPSSNASDFERNTLSPTRSSSSVAQVLSTGSPGGSSLGKSKDLVNHSSSTGNQSVKPRKTVDTNSKESKASEKSVREKDSKIISGKTEVDSTIIGALEPGKEPEKKKPGPEKREPRIIVEPSRDYNFSSPVDYAKRRFINVNLNEGSTWGQSEKPTRSLVTEARTKFEKGLWSTANGDALKPTGNASHHNSPKGVSVTESGSPLHHFHHRHNPVTPFLTKGSVAERVLLFEKRPEIRKEEKVKTETECLEASAAKRSKSPALYSTWRNQDKTQNEVANIARTFGPVSNGKRSRTGLANSGSGVIPKFYFPGGRPLTTSEIENQIRAIRSEFDQLPNGCAKRTHFGKIVKLCKVPLYWKEPLFLYASGSKDPDCGLSCNTFIELWRKLLTSSFDDCSKFVKILTKGKRNYLLPEDFVPLLQDVIDTHPGLTFLKEAVEFHSRYIQTVIARIFYCTNQSWSGRITVPELRKSNFLAVLAALEEEEDINQITDYFSYEHFYVIYCKFWELDKDHDLIIDKYDLSRHNDGAISSRMINRIFSGAVTRGLAHRQGKMTYSEFVWFLLSEEDKKQPRSVEYWFRCMDIDGDGYISMFELEYFYEEQVKRMEAIGIEALPFNDCLCQMLDMIRPKTPYKISLSDLKNCRMSFVFFDTFFNLDKYLDYEQRDPFASKEEENVVSDWDRFAAEEYEILVAEESAQSVRNTTGDSNTKEMRSSGKAQASALKVASKKYGLKASLVDDDDEEGDYAESDPDYSY